MIYILGISSFIGRNLYLQLKRQNIHDITVLSHNEIYKLSNIVSDDTVINFCGINRGNSYNDFDDANHIFVKKIIDQFKNNNIEPYFIHISSIMIHGFVGKMTSELTEYQQNFINSKLAGEKFLIENYSNNRFCIVRPSNIYGYDCEPYYNNIMVTLVYEKILGVHKINKINKNCVRNFLSIDGLCTELEKLIKNQTSGLFDIVSNNDINLEKIIDMIYDKNKPDEIMIEDGENSIPFTENYKRIIHNENLIDKVNLMQDQISKYIELCKKIQINKLNRLSQSRGDMVEITPMQSNRLYMITLNNHSIRGNHYHYTQIEHFYQSKGKVIFLLAHKDDLNVIFFKIIDQDMLVVVNPLIIHTLINDFMENTCEVFVTSTQAFIPDEIPDTEYKNILS